MTSLRRPAEDTYDAALTLFFREGYSAPTMEHIAARLGVSKRTLYKRAPSKRHLLEAALERYFDQMGSAGQAVLDSGAPWPERLVAYLRHIETSIRPAAPVLMGDILASAPWAWERIAAYRHDVVFRRLSDLLAEGAGEGFIRSDLDPTAVPYLYTAIIERVAQPEFLLQADIGFATLIDTVIRILLGGILSEDGRARFRATGDSDVFVPSDGHATAERT
jgi:AcrR family transcriptional regulator